MRSVRGYVFRRQWVARVDGEVIGCLAHDRVQQHELALMIDRQRAFIHALLYFEAGTQVSKAIEFDMRLEFDNARILGCYSRCDAFDLVQLYQGPDHQGPVERPTQEMFVGGSPSKSVSPRDGLKMEPGSLQAEGRYEPSASRRVRKPLWNRSLWSYRSFDLHRLVKDGTRSVLVLVCLAVAGRILRSTG